MTRARIYMPSIISSLRQPTTSTNEEFTHNIKQIIKIIKGTWLDTIMIAWQQMRRLRGAWPFIKIKRENLPWRAHTITFAIDDIATQQLTFRRLTIMTALLNKQRKQTKNIEKI